jgi:hypothetical protein
MFDFSAKQSNIKPRKKYRACWVSFDFLPCPIRCLKNKKFARDPTAVARPISHRDVDRPSTQ